MKIIKVYQKFITERSFNKESVIDELFRKDLEKKIASGKKLNLTDIIANQDVYCGNYTNPEDDTEVCGYHYGEAVEGKRDEWAEKIRGMKCPGCGEVVGNLVEYISPDDLDSYEAKLPGGGFYIFSKGTEDKELLTNNPDNTKSPTTTSKSSTTPIEDKIDPTKIDPTKIYDHIEKNINVLVDAYLAISPQRYKATFTKDVIRKGLVRLQQECKFKDLSRAKEALDVFGDLMKPMVDDANYSKNIKTWRLGSNGKKYYVVFKDFAMLVGNLQF